MSLPDTDAVSRALDFLASTDEEFAGLKGNMRRCEYLLKHHKAVAQIESGEKTAAGKEMQAYASDEYLAAVEELRDAIYEYETVNAKRQRAVLTIEVWRRLNAARKQGASI